MHLTVLRILTTLAVAGTLCNAARAGEVVPGAESARLAAENAKLLEERAALIAKLAACENALRQTERAARSTLDTASGEIKRLRVRVEELRKEISGLQADKEGLRKQLLDLPNVEPGGDEAAKVLANQKKVLVAQIEGLRRELQKERAITVRLKEREAVLSANAAEHAKSRDDLKLELKRAREDLVALHADRKRLADKLTVAEKTLEFMAKQGVKIPAAAEQDPQPDPKKEAF